MSKQKKEPLKLKSLADLRRAIQLGTELKATYHGNHPDIVGLVRVVTKVQTNGFYSKIKDQPNHKFSQDNYGNGFYPSLRKHPYMSLTARLSVCLIPAETMTAYFMKWSFTVPITVLKIQKRRKTI